MSPRVPPLVTLATALVLGACGFDPGSQGKPPGLGGTTTDGDVTTSGPSETASDDAIDSTGPAIPEGPRRRRLDLDPMLVDEDVGGTTILVKLDASRIEYADAQAGGADLRFFGPDPMAAFPIQIERWDPEGTSYVWVKINLPTLPDHLWMYYAEDEPFAAVDPSLVWDGAFAAVWHMELGVGSLVNDTTANAHHLQPIGFEGILPQGWIGAAASFEMPEMAVDAGPLELSDPAALALTDGFTLEAWVSPAVTGANAIAYVLRKPGAWELRALEPMLTRARLVVRTADGSGPYTVEAGASLPVNGWTYLAATYRAEDGPLQIYRNGELEGTIVVDAAPRGRTVADSDEVVQMGRGFAGALDEVRVSNIARSAAWIRLQHASMSDALLMFGPPEPQP
jgi:hypothetical protein